MNPPPRSPDLPFGTDTDEALNALVDGELSAFATEHGITEAVARERLESWPEFASRRAALEAVRHAVGEPTPPLDDLTRRQLVRTATSALPDSSAATPRRGRSWAKITAVAAAGLLVVAGIGYAISSMGSREDSMRSSTAGSAADASVALRGNVGDLGDVTSPKALRALFDRPAVAPAAGSDKGAAGGGEQFDRKALPGPDECARQLAGTRPVTFVGTGTYQGAPVTIVGITKGGRTIVFVVPSADCTKVLTSISR